MATKTGILNITGITDNGTGDYTINWDTDFAGTSYAWIGSGEATTTGATGYALAVTQPNGSPAGSDYSVTINQLRRAGRQA